jgi:enolase 1/2/3
VGRLGPTQRTSRVQLVGDDILVTNPAIVAEAIDRKIANATPTRSVPTPRSWRQCGSAWAQIVSHRWGETEDTVIADLATGTGCGKLKTGAPARGERIAKYNRLIQIEAGQALPYGLA